MQHLQKTGGGVPVMVDQHRSRPPRIPRLRLLPFTLSNADSVHHLHAPLASATMSPMTTRDFKVFLEPDEDYGGYVLVCPSIPGCYSHGKSDSEALANFRETLDLYIDINLNRREARP